jgi:hypothetical protein
LSTVRLAAFAVLLAFVPSFLLICGTTLLSDITGSGVASRDYISYWAAGKLLAQHHDPYDVHAILELEGRDSRAVVMRNPPWSLWITLPLGFVSAVNGSRLWHLMLAAALALSTYYLRGKRRDYGAAFLFAPAICCIAYGQTSLFVLLGVCGFIYFREERPLIAGAALSLCALKPHLLLPFFTVVLAWTLTRRSFALIGGLTASWAGEFVLVRALDPNIWSHYRHTMLSSGIDTEFIPTVSGTIRHFSACPLWLQFAPTLIATIWAVTYYLGHAEEWDWTRHGSLVLTVSILFAPYAWLADLVLFWPVLMPRLRTRRIHIVALLVSGAMLLQLCLGVEAHSMLALWPPLAWTTLFFFRRPTDQRTVARSLANAQSAMSTSADERERATA